jgi:predicted O-methyltransferase YrrM
MLLESIELFAKLETSTTHLVIYTNTVHMNTIKGSHLFCPDWIQFEINDTYVSVDQACKARLDLFQLSCISHYDTILYIDTDIIIAGDINQVFSLCQEDKLYVVQENELKSNPYAADYYGFSLFSESQLSALPNWYTFTSGMMLFRNSPRMHSFFEKVYNDTKTRTQIRTFVDQSFIVHHALVDQLHDFGLGSLAINNNFDITVPHVIHHFPGWVGRHEIKLPKMASFLFQKKHQAIQDYVRTTKEIVDTHLMPIIHRCGEPLEGNIFMGHLTTTYTSQYEMKVNNICSVVMPCSVQKVMEIGFNAGFSTLLMLVSNPSIHVTCVDLGDHSYTVPCFNKLHELFGDRIRLVLGDSTETLKRLVDRYDLIHIDGGHSTEVARSDILQSFRLSKEGTVLIMDDYDFGNLHALWDWSVCHYSLRPLQISLYPSPHHDIKQV